LAWLDQPCAGTLGWGTPPEVDPCLRLRQPNGCSPLPRPFRPVTPWLRSSGCSLGGLLQPLLPVAGCLGTWVLFSPTGVLTFVWARTFRSLPPGSRRFHPAAFRPPGFRVTMAFQPRLPPPSAWSHGPSSTSGGGVPTGSRPTVSRCFHPTALSAAWVSGLPGLCSPGSPPPSAWPHGPMSTLGGAEIPTRVRAPDFSV
jgi:hypothetical protein